MKNPAKTVERKLNEVADLIGLWETGRTVYLLRERLAAARKTLSDCHADIRDYPPCLSETGRAHAHRLGELMRKIRAARVAEGYERRIQ